MDLTTIIRKLDLSAAKIVFYRLFNKEALYEYILDRANTGVNLMLESEWVYVCEIRNRLGSISSKLVEYAAYIPAPWKPYADAVNNALLAVYNATADGKIDNDEARACIDTFRLAYSSFKAD